MAEQAISAPRSSDESAAGELAELREELFRSREEVLRLRDLLIGKDAELGTLRGRLAELEADSARLLNLGARLRARTPGFVLSARARLRERRGAQG
jgi:sugar/nucleoside kinase (ribokinase family)